MGRKYTHKEVCGIAQEKVKTLSTINKNYKALTKSFEKIEINAVS